MKRKSIISILCFMMAACFFAGCDMLGIGVEPHVHTFDTVWTHDATAHWYEATCECEDVEVVKANHVDENNDSLCDVCKYDYDHTHTFQTEDDWTVDCTNHWRAATCGHLVAAKDVEAHADTDEDGKCDTCKYMIKDIHEHVYADGWTTDADYHWHAARCEHKAEISGKEAHSVDASGECTVCGAEVEKIDATDFAAVLAAANAKSYMVIDGKVAYENTVYDGTAGAYTVGNWTEEEIYYVIGDNAAYRTETITNANGTTIDQYWFEHVNAEDEDLFCLHLQGGENQLTMLNGPMYALNGYTYYPGSVLKELDYPKLEEAVLGLYNILVADVHVSDVEAATYDAETGVYSFAYTYFTVNATEGSSTPGGTGDLTTDGDTSDNTMSYEAELYEVAVKFTVDENKVINWADFSVNVYRDYAMDDDVDYDPETDTVTMNAGANPTVYAYVVTQTSGERTYTTPYPKTSVVPSDFDLLYATETGYDDNYNRIPLATEKIENNALTVDAGAMQLLPLGNIYPVSANPAFLNTEDIQISMVNKADGSELYAYYSFQSSCVCFYSKPGEWTLTVTCGEIVKVVDVTVKPAKATEINPYVFTLQEGWMGTYYGANYPSYSETVEVGEAVNFTAVVSPNTASQAFTYTLSDTTNATITEVELNTVSLDYTNYDTYAALQFVANAIGMYDIVLEDQDGLVSTVLTIMVVPAPITLVEGDNNVEISEEVFEMGEPVQATFVAEKAGYYTFESEFLSANIFTEAGSYVGYNAAMLDAGTYTISIPVWSISEAGTYALSIVYTAEEDMSVETWLSLLDGEDFEMPGNYQVAFNSVDGESVLNAWGDTWNLYFTHTTTKNEDGSFTIKPATLLVDDSTGTDELNVAGMTFTATYEDGEWSLESDAEFEVVIETTPLNIGNNNINQQDVNFAYTALADGTLTLSLGNAIMGPVSMSYAINGGDSVALTLGEAVEVAMKEGDVIIIAVIAKGYSSLGATWAAPASAETALVIGNNSIDRKDVVFAYTASEEGTLKLDLGAAIMGAVSAVYSVNGGASVDFALSSSVELALAEGDKVVITVTAKGYSTITATWTVEGAGSEESTGDGSEANPYVLETLPESLTIQSDTMNKTYYLFTATESGTLTFTWPTEDSWVDIFEMNGSLTTSNSESAYSTETFSFAIEAGKTYRFSLCTWNNAGEVTIAISVEQSQGGSSVKDTSGAYIGANGSGRAMKVTIDAAAGTLSVIRAALAGNSLDTATGATEYKGTYSYDGSNVTCEISGCTITWNADGTPASVVWGSATYTGFTLEA